MKTGQELIRIERVEQMVKHNKKNDSQENPYGQLKDAAVYLLTGDPFFYPGNWSQEWKEKFDKKNEIQKLIVAGALIAAEIDRLSEEK